MPYFNFVSFQLGPLTIYVWGLFAALGFLASLLISSRLVKKRGLDQDFLYALFLWVIVGALIGARIVHVVFYNWPYFSQHLWEILDIRGGGLSSYGGFLGGVLAAFWYSRRNNVRLLPYADALAFSFPFGWALGRLGCALINDHPGKLTNFFLGVRYPDGVRHDLGLYEMLLTMILAGIFLLFERPRQSGGVEKQGVIPAEAGIQTTKNFYLVFLGLWYGVTRFFLDFLRINEPRLLGLTPGQYFSLILVAATFLSVLKANSYKLKAKN